MGKTRTLLESTNDYTIDTYNYCNDNGYSSYCNMWTTKIDATKILEFLKSAEISNLLSLEDNNLENCLHYVLSDQLFKGKKYKAYSDEDFFIEHKYTFSSKKTIKKELANTTTIKDYQNKQFGQLNNIVGAILAAFSPVNTKTNDKLFKLLSQQRKFGGETPLHCAFKYMKKRHFLSLFDRIKQLTPQQKKDLIVLQDSDGKNILHLVVDSWHELMFLLLLDVFGEDAIKTASDQEDYSGNTLLHTLSSSEMKRSKLFNILPPFITSRISLTKENTIGENALHTVCESKEYELVDLMCTQFEGKVEQKEGKSEEKESDITKTIAIKKQTCKGLNVAHYAAKSGIDKIFSRIFEGISPEEKQIIATQKDKQEWTLLHYACRYGSTEMITEVITMQGLVDAHRIARIESPRELKILLSKNTNESKMPLSVFDDELSKTTHFMDAYHYLINRFQEYNLTQSRIRDKEERLQDFIQVIKCRKEQKALPSTHGFKSPRYFCGLFQFGSERYYQHRVKLQIVSPEKTEIFIGHLRKQKTKCERAKSIVESIDKVPPIPSAPPYEPDDEPGSTTLKLK